MNNEVIINVSARHIHLSEEHLFVLFGEGYQLTEFKKLYQPGEFAAEEKVVLKSGDRQIENVRVLGPLRSKTQVEISKTDSYLMKLDPPIRSSGDLIGSSGIEIVGPKGSVQLDEGCIIANRHIHMSTKEAELLGVVNKQEVAVSVDTQKSSILKNVYCKVSDKYKLEMHIDVDDANACFIQSGSGSIGKIIVD